MYIWMSLNFYCLPHTAHRMEEKYLSSTGSIPLSRIPESPASPKGSPCTQTFLCFHPMSLSSLFLLGPSMPPSLLNHTYSQRPSQTLQPPGNLFRCFQLHVLSPSCKSLQHFVHASAIAFLISCLIIITCIIISPPPGKTGRAPKDRTGSYLL